MFEITPEYPWEFEDVLMFVEKLLMLIENPSLRKKMGKQAHEAVRFFAVTMVD